MSVPNVYWTKKTKMSVDLREMVRATRKAHPEWFEAKEVTETTMDAQGKVTTHVKKEARALQMSGKRRHYLSLQRETF